MADDAAIKTYRYLRIAMILVVALVAASVLFERTRVSCWQTSISAYYYTPVRAIFVGALLAVALCLIVIKGNTLAEDAALNTAGMFAPIVAVVPTSGVGVCWSIEPEPLPVEPDGSLAPWVVANIDNNITSLLIVGFVGIAVTFTLASIARRSVREAARNVEPGTGIGLAIAFVLLVVGLILFNVWDDFDTKSHGYAAVAMFGFLAVAVGLNAWAHRNRSRSYLLLYAAITVLMVVAAVVVFVAGKRWDHGVLILEIIEITLFAAFWIVQTRELWNETVRTPETGTATT